MITIKVTPTKGMRDLLPQEVLIRDHAMNVILKNFNKWGFQHIETPCVEDISLLTNGDGGENEKMLYKILKRGNKLDLLKTNLSEKEITDLGLRFDLTVPLSRFFVNNKSKLIYPFKSIQIGPVWRAERPQKGRYRQFIQCDIDIIGEKSNIAEILLLSAITDALLDLGLNNFVLHINDRRILIGLAEYFGFKEDEYTSLFITLDKLDKIGKSGVLNELENKGFDHLKINRFINFITELIDSNLTYQESLSSLPNNVNESVIESLEEIIQTYEANFNTKVILDFSLIRGMSYYTGPIFEIEVEGFRGSVAGGGRYDGMISKFTNENEPSCGFSIGFERILTILQDKDLKIKEDDDKVVLLYTESTPLPTILKKARELINQGKIVSTYSERKNLKYQLDQLKKEGYNFFCFVEDEDLKIKPIN